MLAQSLRNHNTQKEIVVLITPHVSQECRLVSRTFTPGNVNHLTGLIAWSYTLCCVTGVCWNSFLITLSA